ncbi:MAG TPA: hypothetical protein VGB45_00845 [Abditibacterium sp.]
MDFLFLLNDQFSKVEKKRFYLWRVFLCEWRDGKNVAFRTLARYGADIACRLVVWLKLVNVMKLPCGMNGHIMAIHQNGREPICIHFQ